MRTIILSLVVSILILSGTVVFAEEPMVNISPRLHPNLATAQRLSRKAFEKIVAAQKSNEYDMGGHAEKAKELLEQVNVELKLAAQDANKNKGK